MFNVLKSISISKYILNK